MAVILIIGAVLVWLGGLIGGFVLIGDSVIIALSIWAGAFFEGALFFAVGKIYDKTVECQNSEMDSRNFSESDSCCEKTTCESSDGNNDSPENIVPQFPPIDTDAMSYVDSKQAFNAAYKAHYTYKAYREAYILYQSIVDSYPSSDEARYSRQQLENIKRKIDIGLISIGEA